MDEAINAVENSIENQKKRRRPRWVPSPSFPAYKVSNLGQVKGKGKPLTPFVFRKRWCVCLHGHITSAVASLVAEAFLGVERLKLKTHLRLTHRNGDPSDNRPENLRLTPRLRTPLVDLARASALLEDGVSHALIRQITGVTRPRLQSYRRILKRS